MTNLTPILLLFVGSLASCSAWIRSLRYSMPLDGLSQEQNDCLSRKYEDASDTLTTCGNMFLDLEEFIVDWDQLNASTRNEYIGKYHAQVSKAISCLNGPVEQVTQCLENRQALILLGQHNASLTSLDLLCKNNGEIMFPDGVNFDSCISKITEYMEECGSPFSNVSKMLEVANYSAVQCQKLADSRNCVQRKVNECNSFRSMELFDVYYQALMNDSPCGCRNSAND